MEGLISERQDTAVFLSDMLENAHLFTSQLLCIWNGEWTQKHSNNINCNIYLEVHVM